MAGCIPVGSIFSVAFNMVCRIWERIDQLSICDKTQKRILDTLDNVKRSLRKVELNIKEDDDIRELNSFVSLLHKVEHMCGAPVDYTTVCKFLMCDRQNSHSAVCKIITAPKSLLTFMPLKKN